MTTTHPPAHARQSLPPTPGAEQTMYYPITEHTRFGSIAAMCRRQGWPRKVIDDYIAHAAIHQSDLVVCDRLVLGNPDNKMCAVLWLQAGGAVVLCCGLFSEASTDLEEVNLMAAEFSLLPQFKGKLVAIGACRPAQNRTMQ